MSGLQMRVMVISINQLPIIGNLHHQWLHTMAVTQKKFPGERHDCTCMATQSAHEYWLAAAERGFYSDINYFDHKTKIDFYKK